jgi:phage terminase large subunit-like protein
MEISYSQRQQLEKKALLETELIRRGEGDPLTTFDLFSPQREFANDVLDMRYKEYFYIGANRSGKSDAGAYAGAHLARFGYRKNRHKRRAVGAKGSTTTVRDFATSGWVSALDFPTGRDTIQPKYFDNGFAPPGATHMPFIPKREIADWRVSDQILKLKNGSIIGFKSADSGRTKYQGAEKDWIHFDEEHSKAIYDEAIIRVGANPLHIFTTCTLLPPEGTVGGITWIYTEIVRKWKQGILENAEIYNASIFDNPHIPREEIAFLESKYPEGSDQRRIRLNGELIGGIGGARVYSAFQHKLNIREQGDIALRRPLAWCWDFNVEPMISLVGQRERGLFRVFEEFHLDEGNIPEMCEMFKRNYPYHMAEVWVYGDATGQSRTAQTNRSSYQIILNEMKDYPAPLRLKIPTKNPPVTDRINSMNMALRGPGAEISLEIDPSCEELIEDFDQVVGDGKQGIKKTFNKKDPYFKRTHLSDALGYWIFAEAPVVPIKTENKGRRIKMKTPSYRRA